MREFLGGIAAATRSPESPTGLALMVVPQGMGDAGQSDARPVGIISNGAMLDVSLRDALKPLGLDYRVRNGRVPIGRLGDMPD